ncbi:unnamed protein product [Adineta steineri]|uniref:WWE domain-containing protein n=2 Tax=Adineta steineri TaxID=433720 RepID=A0A819M403_9BILA|nr:unnamed protein product [Adineta steineri]CAF3973612.1 unnamed protein product [Adineta steineri]
MATSMSIRPSESRDPFTRVQWMWNSNENPFSECERDGWRPYSDIENIIIEEAFLAGETLVNFDDYDIDLEHKVQISNLDSDKQRQIKRVKCGKDDKHLREKRFLPNPVAPDRPFGDRYGFIPPFIKETVKHLKLTKDQLPSKNETIVPEIVEKAALGIIEEGKNIRKRTQAERIAKKLRETKASGMKDVWACCAEIYSWQTFVFKKLNEAMRFIGSRQHEEVWRSKIGTLGPFCLLLWDNPFNSKMVEPGTILYRGAQLSGDLITLFIDDCLKDPRPWHSFQAFTSCTRNRDVAVMFGNVLFIMEARIAFTADIQSYSAHSEEEEELLFPGVSFTINRVEFDEIDNKPLIYIVLQQRRDRTDQHHLNPNSTKSAQQKTLKLTSCPPNNRFHPTDADTGTNNNYHFTARASNPNLTEPARQKTLKLTSCPPNDRFRPAVADTGINNNYHFTARVFNPLPDRCPDPDEVLANTNDLKQFLAAFVARCQYDLFREFAAYNGVNVDNIRGVADDVILDRRGNAYFGDSDPVSFGTADVHVDPDDVYFDRAGYDRDWNED